jgi:hypothetical protein
MSKGSPQQEGKEISVAKSGKERRMKKLYKNTNYLAILAGSFVTKHAYDSNPRQRDTAEAGIFKFLLQVEYLHIFVKNTMLECNIHRYILDPI